MEKKDLSERLTYREISSAPMKRKYKSPRLDGKVPEYEDLVNFIQQELDKAREEGYGLASFRRDKWLTPPTVIIYGRRRDKQPEMLLRARLVSDNKDLLEDIRKYINKEISKLEGETK